MKTYFLIYLALMAGLCSCQQNSETAKTNNTSVELPEKLASILSEMTIDEKIAELTQNAPANERLGIPEMRFAEAIHGLWIFQEKTPVTMYPHSIALGSTWEPELITEMTTHIAKEARAMGISHCYSPNLDVSIGDPRYGRIEESYSEDPYLVSEMGVAFINGLQGTGEERFDENHILATAKHFVAYPENRTGINGAFSDISERRLHEIFLPPFEAAVKRAKVGCIMPGHQDLNGIPMHMHVPLLKDLLRDEWGFDGFIVSDNNDVLRLKTMHQMVATRTEAALLGLMAGVDMDLVLGKSPVNAAYLPETLKDTLMKNPELMKFVDQSVSRILLMKEKLGLFDMTQTKSETSVSSKEAQATALKIGQKALTLLKNDNDLLPLDINKIKSIAVIGPNAAENQQKNGNITQLGSYSGIPPFYTSVLEGIQSKVGNKVKVNYAEGCTLKGTSKAGFANAIRAAKQSDVVILAVGGSTETCGEGLDRADLNLSGVQRDLVKAINKTGKPIVVVLINGRPLTINYISENIPAILESWYLGIHAGDAIADVLFGDYNPGGKLTMTFPRSVGHIPVSYLQKPDFIGSGKGQYKFSDKTPLFHFGYGLSYTTFSYSEPTLQETSIKAGASTSVSVDVTNTGKRIGEEVVQMYIRDDFGTVGRYNKMLKGFKRISLEPGETKTVTFELNEENLSLFNQQMEKIVEPGTFTIMVGSSSRQEDLKAVSLTVQ